MLSAYSGTGQFFPVLNRVQLRLELLVCDGSVSVNVLTNTFVGLKCLTGIKIQILFDHVDLTRFHIVRMGCQMAQLLSAYIVCRTNNVRQFDSLTSWLTGFIRPRRLEPWNEVETSCHE